MQRNECDAFEILLQRPSFGGYLGVRNLLAFGKLASEPSYPTGVFLALRIPIKRSENTGFTGSRRLKREAACTLRTKVDGNFPFHPYKPQPSGLTKSVIIRSRNGQCER